MILKIKQRYGENCIIDRVPTYPNDYHWFKDDQHHFVGILKSSLSIGEKELLSTLLSEVEGVDFNQELKLFWLEILIHNKHEWLNKVVTTQRQVRFVFFTHHFDSELKIGFTQLMKSFNEQSVVLFINQQYGVILDFSHRDEHGFAQTAEAMQTDFYQNINFYATMCYDIDEQLSTHFLREYGLYQSYRMPSALLMNEHDLAMRYLVHQMTDYQGYVMMKQRIAALDSDLIEVAKNYIEYNLNSSMAAKAIYMHRNTFMNKLERFISFTDLNIKEFKYAVLAYVLILGIDT